MSREYWQEENAMLQRMLLQVQREKMGLQEELHNERVKVAMLEQEIAQIANSAQELGHNMAEYFARPAAGADTGAAPDQGRPAPLQGTNSTSFDPAALQLQCIPEQMRKPQGMLDVANDLRSFAANLQQRLANLSAANTPTAAEAAAAAAAGPFSEAPAAAAVANPFCKGPSRAHSTSVPSEHQHSMDLPMQALEMSRLALQLHQPQCATAAGGEDTSYYSSSGRKSSCTVLGGSVDLTSSINSLRSLLASQQSTATGHGMQELLPGSADVHPVHFSHSSQVVRNTAARCAVTRGAAAIASQCATIAAAAAATAAASAARKAAAATAMIDRSQERMEQRAESESGFSSLTSPGASDVVSGPFSGGLHRRQEYQHQEQEWQHQHYTTNPLWAPSPVEEVSETDNDTRPSSTEPGDVAAVNAAAAHVPPSAWAALQDSNSGSGSTPSSAQPTPESAGAQQQAADVLPKLPAVPANLTLPQHAQEAGAQHAKQQPAHQQQHHMQPVTLMQLQLQPQQHHDSPRDAHQHDHERHFRYGSDKTSQLTSPDQTASSGCSVPMLAQPPPTASMIGRPMLQHTPVQKAARPSGVGPLHRNLASLSSSFSSPLIRATATGAAIAVGQGGMFERKVTCTVRLEHKSQAMSPQLH